MSDKRNGGKRTRESVNRRKPSAASKRPKPTPNANGNGGFDGAPF